MATYNIFNPGQLKRRISIMEMVKVPDGGGGFDESLSEVFSVRAHIQPLSGNQYFSNQQTEANVTHKITIRYIDGIKQSQVISYNGKLFDIQYFYDVDEQRRFIELYTLERREA